MAHQMVTLMCHWDGRITTGSEGPDYEGGRLKGIRVNYRTGHLELLGKMYGITGYDKRQFDIKMICRFPVSRGYIVYEIDDDDSAEIMFELGRKRTFVGVELYLEKKPLHIDCVRNDPLSTRMLSQGAETCSLASIGNAGNGGSPSPGGFAAGTGGCLGSRVGLTRFSSQQNGVGASDGTSDCFTVGHGEERDEWSQTNVANVDEAETVNREQETEGITLMSEEISHAHTYVGNEDFHAHVADLDEGVAVDCEWEMSETDGKTTVSKPIAHAYVANEDGEVGHYNHLMHEDVYEEVVLDCEQEMNETQGNISMSEVVAHAQVRNEDDELPHAHLANNFAQVDAYAVDPGGERNKGDASLSVVVSNNNFVEVEQTPAYELTNNDRVNDAVASNHVPGFPVVVQNSESDLHVGQIFQTKQQLQLIVKEYAIRAHREYVVLESTPSLLALKCKNEGCPWRLRAPLKKSIGCFMITKYAGPHACVNPNVDQDHAQLDAEFICSKILGTVKEQVSVTPAAIVVHMQQTYNYNISYMKAWTAKQKALEKIFGDCKENYVKEPGTADSEVVCIASMGPSSDGVVPTLEATVDPTEGILQPTQLAEDEHDAATDSPPEEKRRVAKRKRSNIIHRQVRQFING